MALPNTSSTNTGAGNNNSSTGTFAPNSAYSPNTAAMSQMGISVASARQLQDQNQAISKILDNISTRLGNITNMRTNTQSAIFESFGNNFVSRGMSQMVNSLTDSIESVLTPPQEEKDDPSVVALKKQTELLTKISETGIENTLLLTNQNHTSDAILTYTKQNKTIAFASHGATIKLLEFSKRANLDVIGEMQMTTMAIERLTDIDSAHNDKLDTTISELKSLIRGMANASKSYRGGRHKIIDPAHETDASKVKRSFKMPSPNDISDVPSAEPAPSVAQGTEQPPISSKHVFDEKTFNLFTSIAKSSAESKTLLETMVDIQKECCENISKMSRSLEDSKEATINAQARTEEVKAKESAETPVTPPVGRTGITRRASDLLKSFSPFRATPAVSSTATAVEAEPAADSSGIGDAAAAGAAGAAMTPIIKSIGGKLLKFGKAVGPGALASLAGEGIQYGGDALKDSGYEETGKAVGVGGTALKYAGYGAMLGSVVPGIGTAGGALGGALLGAGKGIYDQYFDSPKRERESYSNPGQASERNLNTIEQNAKELENNKNKTATETPSTNIVNSNITNNTVVANRAVVKNTDDSYNRYISTTMGRFA